ncbi:SEC-C metal-binding domain-containing protein [Candidatus Accumulibacter necessarius]
MEPAWCCGSDLVHSFPAVDQCPCGSGKKFRKCCGAGYAPAALH